jgi:SAM-dependent MidA family methyltransferase
LLTIDYSLSLEELLSPSRTEGTLRSYRQHRVLGDVLECPGEQDITAHVDFEALSIRGELEGLKTEALISQSSFLTGAARLLMQETRDGWGSRETRQFQTLTHPDFLGRSFQVLVQSKRL